MNNTSYFLNRLLALEPLRAASLLHPLSEQAIHSLRIEDNQDYDRPYQVYGNIALIPIKGVLVSNIPYFCWERCTTYNDIYYQLASAINDSAIAKIVLLISSPGGEASGCFDLAESIFALRGEKPIVAILDDHAYSAAYALASAADLITIPRGGGIGSIGVIAMHTDITGALNQSGIKITTITYGKYKAETAPTTPLSDDARARMQAEVNIMGEWFVDLVARNRNLSTQKIKALEAGTFLGFQGVEIGLADFVLTADQAFLLTQNL